MSRATVESEVCPVIACSTKCQLSTFGKESSTTPPARWWGSFTMSGTRRNDARRSAVSGSVRSGGRR